MAPEACRRLFFSGVGLFGGDRFARTGAGPAF